MVQNLWLLLNRSQTASALSGASMAMRRWNGCCPKTLTSPGDARHNPNVPSRQQHLANAESNQRLSLALQAGPHIDWSVTVLFYAALHLVEAALAPQTHSANHNARFANIRRHPQIRHVYFDYYELYTRSLDARYDCAPFTMQQVQTLYLPRYEPIKRHLQPLLGFTF